VFVNKVPSKQPSKMPIKSPTSRPTGGDKCRVLADPVDKGYAGTSGWYDVSGCGVCNDYCRKVGGPGPIWFSCKLAGTTQDYTPVKHDWGTQGNMFSWKKCSGKGAKPPVLTVAEEVV
jgi:hypothetical protein